MDDIKLVVKELNKAPFNKNLNIVSYDSLRGDQRLEMLFQVFKEIDPKINIEALQASEPEEMIATILDILRILKYTPPSNIQASEFRQGIILGDRAILTDILSWLLTKLSALKTRAYLAKFLVKIELSPDVEGDHDVVVLYQQYQRLVEDFKTIHSTNENLSKTVGSVQEIQKDIKSMETEKEQVTEKLINIKRRVDANSNNQLFSLVREFKDEAEKNEKLKRQNTNLETELSHLQQTMKRNEQQLKELESNVQSGSSPDELLEKMEEEVRAKRQLLKEILPKELEQLQRYVKDLEEIESQPRMGQDYLNKISAKIQIVNREMNEFIEKKMLNNDPMDDKLALFKQNASTVAEKRKAMAEKMKNAELELKKLKEELNQRRAGFKGADCPLKGEALKEYIAELRNKSVTFKKKKTELAEMKTELDVMERTLDLLRQKDQEMMQIITDLEEKKGIAGYFLMQENTRFEQKTSSDKEESTDEIKGNIKRLTDTINEKKAELAPVIKDLRPLRHQSQELQAQYEQKKQAYDKVAASLETNLHKLEVEVGKIRDEYNAIESSQFLMKCQTEVYEARQEILNEEMKLYLSQDSDEKGKSMQEKIEKEIEAEQEKSETFKQRQRELKNNEVANKKQLKMWKDLQTLFEVKRRCMKEQTENKVDHTANASKRDYLVL